MSCRDWCENAHTHTRSECTVPESWFACKRETERVQIQIDVCCLFISILSAQIILTCTVQWKWERKCLGCILLHDCNFLTHVLVNDEEKTAKKNKVQWYFKSIFKRTSFFYCLLISFRINIFSIGFESLCRRFAYIKFKSNNSNSSSAYTY